MFANSIVPLVTQVIAPLAGQAISDLRESIDFREILASKDQTEESQQAAGGESEFVAINSDQSQISELNSRLQKLSEQLSEKLSTLLAGRGINLNQPISLATNGTGGVVMKGDHPQRVQIEQLVNGAGTIKTLVHDLLSSRHEIDQLKNGRQIVPTEKESDEARQETGSMRPSALLDYRVDFLRDRVSISELNS